jgi:hypothetical protein
MLENTLHGKIVKRFLVKFVISALILASIAYGQDVSSKLSGITSSSTSDPIQPENASDIALDPASLLPDLPPLPPASATLVGGVIAKLDRVKDQLTIQVFGGGKTSAAFDPRTHVYRDGHPASIAELKLGERVYVDTILDGSTIFARNIRVNTAAAQGENQGVVTSYRADTGELEVRDLISADPVRMRITPQTRIVKGGQPAASTDLAPGSLVSVRFGTEQSGRVMAQQVSILAVQGASFTFVGKVTFLDLRAGLLVLTSDTNHRTYEIYLDPSIAINENLRNGAEVSAQAQFDGNRYVAHSLTVTSHSEE